MRLAKWRASNLVAVTAVTACAIAASAAGGDEWPRFRGPNGAGLAEANIPVQWTEKDYNWKVTLPGGGHSSPVVWGQRLFVTSGLGNSGRRIVLGLRTSDGSTLWKREFDSNVCPISEFNSYATTTPALDQDFCFVTWATPEKYTVLALDHDGNQVWRRDLPGFVGEHGHGGSSIVFGDLLIVPNDNDGNGSLSALDRRTGKTLWEVPRQGTTYRGSYSTPCVYQPKDGHPQLIFVAGPHGMTGLDAMTGKRIWQVPDAFPSKRLVASPVVWGDTILNPCGEGMEGSYVVAVKVGNPPAVAWKTTRAAPYVVTALVKGELAFLWADTGTVTCVKAADGQEVWREKVGGEFYGSPVCVGSRLYCISTKGDVVVLAAADKYQLLARNPLGEKSFATPAVAGGRMYLRTYSHLISIGGK